MTPGCRSESIIVPSLLLMSDSVGVRSHQGNSLKPFPAELVPCPPIRVLRSRARLDQTLEVILPSPPLFAALSFLTSRVDFLTRLIVHSDFISPRLDGPRFVQGYSDGWADRRTGGWHRAPEATMPLASLVLRDGTGSEDPSGLSLFLMWGLVTLEVRGVDAG